MGSQPRRAAGEEKKMDPHTKNSMKHTREEVFFSPRGSFLVGGGIYRTYFAASSPRLSLERRARRHQPQGREIIGRIVGRRLMAGV